MTEISRRRLLEAGVLGLALSPLLSTRDALAAATATNPLARSRFTPYLNKSFKMVSPTSSWPVTLVQISDLQPTVVSADENRYRLTFQTAAAGPTQETYSFQRPGFTSTSLFVVPSDTGRRYYQAVVNRS